MATEPGEEQVESARKPLLKTPDFPVIKAGAEEVQDAPLSSHGKKKKKKAKKGKVSKIIDRGEGPEITDDELR